MKTQQAIALMINKYRTLRELYYEKDLDKYCVYKTMVDDLEILQNVKKKK